jgi:hypothetical protein
VERRKLSLADAFFFLLLLLGKLQFFVTSAPEFSELLVFLFNRGLFFVESLDLKLTTSFNGELHLHLSALLLFEESVGLVLCLSNLLVQDLLLVVLDGAELANLPVDHATTFGLFLFEALRFFLLFHEVTTSLLSGEFFNFLFFLKFLATGFILEYDLSLVGFNQL